VSDDSAFGRSHFSDDGAALLQPLQRQLRWRSVGSDCHFSGDGKTISIVMQAAAAFYSPSAAAASVQQQQPHLQLQQQRLRSDLICSQHIRMQQQPAQSRGRQLDRHRQRQQLLRPELLAAASLQCHLGITPRAHAAAAVLSVRTLREYSAAAVSHQRQK
jgi:hypothetical protein